MDSSLRRSLCVSVWYLIVIVSCHTVAFGIDTTSGTADGSEEWGYVDVRAGAHMFWWLYRSPIQTKPSWPLVLWLQGGPGASGVGIGNFEEIGPLTPELTPRQFTWLHKADLLFVDSPVGAGFSYVDNASLILTKDEDVATDLLTFLQTFFENHQALQQSPFYIFAESYGGKHAALLGLALEQAIKEGNIKTVLGGVALGDSWISPVDFVLSWGPVLRHFSRVNRNQENMIYRLAKVIESEVNKGLFLNATIGWGSLEVVVLNLSNNVDFYNLLIDEDQGSSSLLTGSVSFQRRSSFFNFGSYYQKLMLRKKGQSGADITSIMNGPIREKLKIIPKSVVWNEVSRLVFDALQNDFMKDVIKQVDELLSREVNVIIYNGQVDLICATEGTEAWIQKLNWPYLESFYASNRMPLYCNSTGGTAAFVQSYKNLSFYWILLAGHMVPADNPCIALDMLELITSH